ncbi:MAG: alpha/beta fold hydrolase [Planctomycetota bacterium]
MANWESLYPFESRFLELPKSETSVDLVRMHYVEQGDPQAEQTVVCVHGNPTWSFTYRRLLADCSSTARVIGVDHIGCGLSDKPQQYPYSLERHVGNLARLIEELDLQRITLVVHDWGGAIGLGAALKVPTRIEKFVILNTAAFPPPYVPWRIAACRLPWIGNFAMRGMNLFAKAALTMTLNRLPALAPEVAEGLIAPYKDWQSRIAIARFVQDIPTRKTQATWQLLENIEQGLGVFQDRTVRLVWGMKDWCFRPECLTRLEGLFPQAQSQRLEDVGHYVMEEAADEVVETVNEILKV